ncbi:MAG: tetratricopeptide repeat protein, partial [Chloroflexota bacterium]
MPDKSVYISYRPEQSLHIAQPLFNGLKGLGYDVFMDINEGVDEVNLHQIAAREHFIILLTPGAISNAKDDRIESEFEQAVAVKRNIVMLLTRDFSFEDELAGVDGLLTHLPRIPTLRIQPKQINQVVRLMEEEHLMQGAKAPLQPTPDDEVDEVARRLDQAREYTQQATIRLNTEKLFFQAVVKIRRGDHDGALMDLDLVISDNPNNESAYLHRGRVLRKKGRKTAALKDYEQATRLSPKLVAAHVGRGELLLETERFKQAMD